MTSEDRSELILAIARVLYVNGQATDQIVAAIRRFGNKLGIKAELLPSWGELQLRVEGGGVTPVSYVAADPTGVDMDRVVSATKAIMDIEAGRLPFEEARRRIGAIAKAPPAPPWLFALAAAAGAVALAIIFGIQQQLTAQLIFISAGAGGLLRRAIARADPSQVAAWIKGKFAPLHCG